MSIRPQGAEDPLVASAAADAGGRQDDPEQPRDAAGEQQAQSPPAVVKPPARVKEIGGPPGPEPTRYGDWQFNGRVTDF
jgi:hypothetical protein